MGPIGTGALSTQKGLFAYQRQHPDMAFWLYSAVVREP